MQREPALDPPSELSRATPHEPTRDDWSQGIAGAQTNRGDAQALEEDVLYSAVDQKPKRSKRLKRLENIRNRPEVAVIVDHYEDDWTQLWWVRLDGTARVLDDGPERERGLALLSAKYEQYRSQPPTGPLIAVRVGRWTGWSSVAVS